MNSEGIVESAFFERMNGMNAYLGFKRAFDIVISLFCIILLSPLMLLIAICIKLESKGTIIYRHRRVGRYGKHIDIYKFRSMYSDSNEKLEELLKDPERLKEWKDNYKLHNDPRITKVGKVLRRTSLDELPQLFNILRGDMSLIGPRPVIDEEIEKFGKNIDRILSIRPGLTGWWAANGRSCTTYEDRVKLEAYYVDHVSLWLDIKCLFKTVGVVFTGHGAK